MPGTDHHSPRWRGRPPSFISGEPASGSDGKTAQGSHTKVLHTPDTGQFIKKLGGTLEMVVVGPGERAIMVLVYFLIFFFFL